MSAVTLPPNRRVLIVDDNEAIHRDFQKILQPPPEATELADDEQLLFGRPSPSEPDVHPFELDSAYQGSDGVLAAEAARRRGEPYALAYLDMRMPPGWDGLETLRYLWQVDADLQVVICTAYSDHSWDEIVEEVGWRDGLLILKKPFDPIEVRQLTSALTVKWDLTRTARLRLTELESLVNRRTSQLRRQFEERVQLEDLLRRQEEQIRQKQKLEAIGSLAGGVAHEFNNLLQTIQGYTTLALANVVRPDQARGDLEQVLAAVQRAASLTRQLLGFSRQREIHLQRVDPRALVDDMMQLVRPLIDEPIELVVEIDEPCEPVYVDPLLIQQVLLNLCVNARDAMPEGGQLLVRTELASITEEEAAQRADLCPGRYVCFSVADEGHGIAPEHIERIFEPFFTTKDVGQGTGLGLSTAYGIVEQHHGAIRVTSQLDVGTTFRVYLPCAAVPTGGASAASRGAATHGAATRERETILVADDEPALRAAAVRILRKAGYHTITAADGAEAVERFTRAADRVSLVLLDVMMPCLTGREASRRIRACRPDVPVVFCTGCDVSMLQQRSTVDEPLSLVHKPFTSAVLLDTVRRAIDDSRAAACETTVA